MIYKQKKKKKNSCQGQPVQTRTHKARLFCLGPLLPYLTPEDSAESITSSGRRAQRPAVPCGLWLWAPHCRPCCLGPCPVGAEAPSRVPSSRWNLLKEKFLNAETQPPWGIGGGGGPHHKAPSLESQNLTLPVPLPTLATGRPSGGFRAGVCAHTLQDPCL